ncbi:hypothetical protein [Bartonella elizabethae]|uniref:hypothetical protein n=1 Tax=Bartonella elizabethae TaxID=807 RepID=UPI00047B6ABB|nr:hypothetical protein [Bartonella elizabethae]
MHQKSANTFQSHTTTVFSILGAMGNIDVDAKKEAIVTASHMIADQDINEIGQSVTIDGMTGHHSSYSQTHEMGFVLI